jgi:1,4-alpha-glucan branching enzyme
VLPLIATDAGLRLQLLTGIEAHRRRFAPWGGGFWLPECAYAPWLDDRLAEAGVGVSCVDLTDLYGLGSPEHLRPVRLPNGVILLPVDWTAIGLVWSEHGYPAHGTYRDYHHHTTHHHRVWGNDGRLYDRPAAASLARRHAAEFVARVVERVAAGGLCVCALDTELLGHWWYEGIGWFQAVLEEAEQQGLRLTTVDDALTRHEPVDAPAAGLPVSTWGAPRDLATWGGAQVAEMAWRARRAELMLVQPDVRLSAAAVRELLALQSSDWAFMVTRKLAGPYPVERADGHADALRSVLAGGDGPGPRGLAPAADPALLERPE